MKDFKTGELIDSRWRVVRVLGRGAFSTVYLVEGQDRQRRALKYLSPYASEDESYFFREVAAISRIRHPAVVRAVTGFRDASTGQYYIVQEYVEGSALRAWASSATAEPMELERIYSIFDQLLDLLEALESADPPIVHRDLKPENLILGAQDRLCVVDFGIASPADRYTRHAYTEGYVPPDHTPGSMVTSDVDRFAAGVILYELLAQEMPYAIDDDEPEPLVLSEPISTKAGCALYRVRARREGRIGSLAPPRCDTPFVRSIPPPHRTTRKVAFQEV